jgi:hypothetical protein
MKKEELIKQYESRLNMIKSWHSYYAERKAHYDCEIKLLEGFIKDLRKL